MDPQAETMTHLSPEGLAGYFDGALPPEEQQRAELHLASCGQCREELAEIRRIRLAWHRRRWAPALIPAAAAAIVLLAVVLPRDVGPSSEIRTGRDEERLAAVSPAPSAQVDPGIVRFIWRSAGPGSSYTLTLQEADGHVVWSAAVTDTTATLPDSLPLASGRTWFWFVDALLPDGRSLSTGVQRLSTRP